MIYKGVKRAEQSPAPTRCGALTQEADEKW